MKWFGIRVVDPEEEITATPVGEACGHCEEFIETGDRGVTFPHIDERGAVEKPYHFECYIRIIVGSLAHQQHRCSCHGGTEHDPPRMTPRQAARAAYDFWQATNRRCDGTSN
jgi:hypothetical protein